MHYKQSYLLIFFSVLLCSCVNPGRTKDSDTATQYLNIPQRIKVAETFQAKKNYASALIQWKVLQAIEPENNEFRQRITDLETTIKHLTQKHLDLANNAYEQGNLRDAKNEYRYVLELNPAQPLAIKRMKNIESRKAKKLYYRSISTLVFSPAEKSSPMLATTTSSEIISGTKSDSVLLTQAITSFEKRNWIDTIRASGSYLESHPQDNKAKNLLAMAHINLSELFENKNQFEPAINNLQNALDHLQKADEKDFYQQRLSTLKQKLAERYYTIGLEIFNDDNDKAIAYWERALHYDPHHESAKEKLQTLLNNKRQPLEINMIPRIN